MGSGRCQGFAGCCSALAPLRARQRGRTGRTWPFRCGSGLSCSACAALCVCAVLGEGACSSFEMGALPWDRPPFTRAAGATAENTLVPRVHLSSRCPEEKREPVRLHGHFPGGRWSFPRGQLFFLVQLVPYRWLFALQWRINGVKQESRCPLSCIITLWRPSESSVSLRCWLLEGRKSSEF